MIEIVDLLAEAAKKSGCAVEDVQWYSWPQVFGSTAGPRRTGGGQMMTVKQVYAFWPLCGEKLKYCAGVWRPWDGSFHDNEW